MIEELFYRLSCYGMIEEKNKIWCVSTKGNILYEIDRDTHMVKALGALEQDGIYTSIKKIGEYLVLIPWYKAKVAIFSGFNHYHD